MSTTYYFDIWARMCYLYLQWTLEKNGLPYVYCDFKYL